MKTILIVDDEPAARYGLRRALESKYRIAEADSAETARGALTTEQPDIVLLDVVMPGQSGIAFLQWMREGKRRAGSDGFGARQCEDCGRSPATWRCGLPRQGVRAGRIAATRCEFVEAVLAGERKRFAAAAADDRRPIRPDDRARRRNAASV